MSKQACDIPKGGLVVLDFHATVEHLILEKGVKVVTTTQEGSEYKVTINNGGISISRLAETPEEALKRAYHAYLSR